MSLPLVLRRSYYQIKSNVLSPGTAMPSFQYKLVLSPRNYSDSNINNAEFTNSTIMIENGFNVQELPVIVRKMKDITNIAEVRPTENVKSSQDSHSYHLIKTEFQQCTDLRDVFTLLSKCTKITPNIALGAIERIYDLEKSPITPDLGTKTIHISLAKGAILDKLLKVVINTEDTQTILNILNTDSLFMQPYKYKFCDELLLRVIDNHMSVEQLCEFIHFLIENKTDIKYSETVDKLWVGFIQKEQVIDESNIALIFEILPGLKSSKKTILNLLEHKLSDLWYKIKVNAMQEILNIFLQEKYFSMQSFAVVGKWFYANIHALDEDVLLDIISKITRLKYTDDLIERAVEKYMKLRGNKIESQVLIVGILNYCMQFQFRNEQVLNTCSQYFEQNGKFVSSSFLKSIIYPFGFLNFEPANRDQFYSLVEKILDERFDKINPDHMSSIMLSSIYANFYMLRIARRLFSAEYLANINNPETLRKLHLIDTALTLECKEYAGPLLPKDQWSKSISQDGRVKNIINKIRDSFESVAGGADKISTAMSVPFLYADETYLIDVMVHPGGLGSNSYNWKSKYIKNENTAILVHLPDHYCSDNEQLIGPQIMRRKHLKLLGMKVASVKYSVLSQFYMSRNKNELESYLADCIQHAESCH